MCRQPATSSSPVYEGSELEVSGDSQAETDSYFDTGCYRFRNSCKRRLLLVDLDSLLKFADRVANGIDCFLSMAAKIGRRLL
jgi:hypothetical protein